MKDKKFTYNCVNGPCIEELVNKNDTIISYSDDNVIYKNGVEHIFDYYYQDSTGKKYFIGLEGYRLTDIDSVNNQTIVEVGYLISAKIEKQLAFPGERKYPQSGIEYSYVNPNQESLYPISGAGLIENEKNIWLHPFRRDLYFAMLNINPYAYVKFPLSTGSTWEWELAVGGQKYTDPIWAVWEGSTIRHHKYQVKGKIKYKVADKGIRDVWEIVATTTGEIGETGGTFYFDEEFGFVMMEWHNINKSIFRFDIKSIVMPDVIYPQ